jgi:ribosomal protein S18 acetylase RimI-like enzyme
VSINVNIRKVKIGDETILAYIQTESWKIAFQQILSKEALDKYTDINKATDMYKNLLNNDAGNGLILSVDEKPHCIAYWDKTREEGMPDYAELICIHSLQNNWGKGYGSMMMDYVIKEIKEAAFDKVMLWVFEDNTRARKFYENHGFVLTEKTKKFSDSVEVMYCKVL